MVLFNQTTQKKFHKEFWKGINLKPQKEKLISTKKVGIKIGKLTWRTSTVTGAYFFFSDGSIMTRMIESVLESRNENLSRKEMDEYLRKTLDEHGLINVFRILLLNMLMEIFLKRKLYERSFIFQNR